MTNKSDRSETTQTIVRAVRALRRYFAPITELHNTFADLDAQFDGGEWSGPANDRQLARVEQQAIDYVAQRFGVNPLLLQAAWEHCDDWEHECFMAALFPKRNERPAYVPEPDDEPAFEERALRGAHRIYREGYYEQCTERYLHDSSAEKKPEDWGQCEYPCNEEVGE